MTGDRKSQKGRSEQRRGLRRDLHVMIDNLLRNAVAYAETCIVVRADARGVEIENDVREQPRRSSSTGYGLQIVSRICERQGWTFAYGCHGRGFVARVAFQETSATHAAA